MLKVNRDMNSDSHKISEDSGSVEFNFQKKIELGVTLITAIMDAKFLEDIAEEKEINDQKYGSQNQT